MFRRHKKLTNPNYKRFLYLSMCLTLIFNIFVCTVYADPDDTGLWKDSEAVVKDGNINTGDADADSATNGGKMITDSAEAGKLFTSMFGSEVWSSANLQAGIGFASPIVSLIMVLSIAITVIICYAFFGVTVLDLAYITVPPCRSLLMRGKEKHDMGASKGFCCISDAAVSAVNGDNGGGGLGGSGDRGTGSCLAKYVSSRTVEFTIFVLFVILFFTGMIGKLVLVIYKLMLPIFGALLNLQN